MTTQESYFWIQTVLQLLVGAGVVWAIVWLSGIVKRAIEFQEKTIAAQSAVLQDAERLSKMMKEYMEVAGDPAALKREQAYKERVERDRAEDIKKLCEWFEEIDDKAIEQIITLVTRETAGDAKLLCDLLRFVYPPLRQALIEAADLTPKRKADLQEFEQIPGYTPVTDDASLEALWDQQRKSAFGTNLTRLAHARANVAEAPSQAGPHP